MAAIDTVGPYVEQLLDNDDVRENLARAAARAQQAYAGVRRMGASKAASDRRVRARIMQAAAATRDAALAVKRGREEQLRREQRRTRRRRLLVGLVLAGATVTAVDEKARTRILAAIGGNDASGPAAGPTEAPHVAGTAAGREGG